MIKVNTGFEMGSIEAIDARIVLTSEQMLNINDNTQPDIYFAMNLDDGKLYIYDKAATPNETTGKFSILEGGANNIWSGTKEEYEAEKDDIPEGTLIIITDDEGEIITNVFADVTQEEYDALPDTKLTDGIAYIISEEDATTAKFVRNGKEISGVNYDEGEAISIESKELEREKKDYSIGYYKTADLDNKGTLYPLSENSTVSYMYQGSDAYYVVKFSKAVDTYDSINFNYTTYGGGGVKQQGPINALTLAENTKLGYINFVKAENDELIFLLNGGCPNGMSIGPFSCSYTESIQGNFISVLYDDETIKLNTDNQLYANINFDNAEATSTLSGSGSTEDPIAVNTNVIATIDFVSNYTQADYSETRVNVPNYIRNKPTYANGIIESSEIEESNIYNIKVYEKYYNSMQKEYKEADYSDGKLNVVTDNVASANGICYIVISLPSPVQSYSNISTTIESVQASLKNCLPGEILYSGGSGSSSGGLNRTITFEKYDSKYYNLILKAVSYTYTASSDVHTPINATYQFTPIKIELYSEHNIELSLTEEQKAEDKIYGYNPVEDEWQEVEAGESIQVLELPEITDDNKDKVYEYVGETTDNYTKGHFYEAKEKTAMFYPYSTDLTVNFREDLPDFIFVKNHEYVDNISVDDLYYKTGDERGKTGDLAKLKLKEGYSFELRRNDMFVIIQPTVDGEPAEDIDETHLQYNRLNEDDAEAVDLPVTEATVLEWTEVEFGSDTEIVTEWEDELSDEKVPSEKLVKDTIDTKLTQVETLPEITDDNKNKVYEYVGETTDDYTKGHLYKVGDVTKYKDCTYRCYVKTSSVDNTYVYINEEEKIIYGDTTNKLTTIEELKATVSGLTFVSMDDTTLKALLFGKFSATFTREEESDITEPVPYIEEGWAEIYNSNSSTIFTPDSNATTVAVGGVPKGYDFTDKEYTINEVLNMIFFPYVAFTYTALAGGGSYEYGKEVTISKVTPTYEAGSKAITTVSVGTTAGSNDLYEGTSYASGAITLTTSKTFDGTTGGKVYCKLSDGTTTLEQSTTVSYVKSIYYATTDSATVAPTSGTKGNNVDITVAADNYIYFLCPDTTKTQIQQYAVGQWNNVDTTYVGEVEFTNSENAALTYHAYRTPKLAAMTGKFQIK